jgi:hypothetical protein
MRLLALPILARSAGLEALSITVLMALSLSEEVDGTRPSAAAVLVDRSAQLRCALVGLFLAGCRGRVMLDGRDCGPKSVELAAFAAADSAVGDLGACSIEADIDVEWRQW